MMSTCLPYLGFILIASFYACNAHIRESPHFVLTKAASQKIPDFEAPLHRLQRSATPRKSPEARPASYQQASVERFHIISHVTLRSSRVVMTSDVRNDENHAQEVAIELRLPKNAFISNFSMEIDSVIYVGKVKEKQAAKAQYQAAVSRGESAGLVSSKVREAQNFAVSVNVAAGRVVSFRLDYQELLIRKLGKYTQAIYANPGKLVNDLKIEVTISEPSGIGKLTAAPPVLDKTLGHRNSLDAQENVVIRRSKTQAYISYNPTLAQQKQMSSGKATFLVTYDVAREELGGEVLIKDGYFVHFFAPQNLPVIPKNIVFIIDRSGSMMGSKIKQTKRAFLTILDDLREQDKFNIISFSSESQMWQRNEMMDASKYNIRRAKRFVRDIEATGGTNLYGAAMDGISLLNTTSEGTASSIEQAYMLVLLTDGQPTVGVTELRRIRTDVAEAVNGRYSIFCLGFGSDVDHDFLQKLASENQGLSRQIYEDSDAALQLKGFYDEVASPLLAHVILKYNGAPISGITTSAFDNYFDGSEILVTGRIDLVPEVSEVLRLQALVVARSSEGDVRLESNGKEIEQTFVEEGFDMEKLWAYLTIKDLLKNKTLLRDNDDLAANVIDTEIIRLSLKFNFVTPLTSMVVTKPGDYAVVDEKLPSSDHPSPRPLQMQAKGLTNAAHRSRLMFGLSLPSQSKMIADQHLRMSTAGRRRGKKMRIGRTRLLKKKRKRTKVSFLLSGRRHRPVRKRKNKKGKSRRRPLKRTTEAPTTITSNTMAIDTTTPYINPVPENPLSLAAPTCGEIITIRSPVNITSPRYPELYPSNTQCVWQIRFPEGGNEDRNKRIRITFPRLDIEASCLRDRVIVYQDFDPLERTTGQNNSRLCGYEADGTTMDATDNIIVVFQSDEVVSGRGFMANVVALPADPPMK